MFDRAISIVFCFCIDNTKQLYLFLHWQHKCGKVLILNVFETGINAVSFLPVFLCCVLSVFCSPVATPAHDPLGLSPSFRLRFISENASLLALYICAITRAGFKPIWPISSNRAPRRRGPRARTVARNSSIGGLCACAGGLYVRAGEAWH